MTHTQGISIPKFNVSQEDLKILACVTMLIDQDRKSVV